MTPHAWQAGSPALILASASTTRRRLLEEAGLAFTVHTSELDETEVKRAAREAGAPAGMAAMSLAEAKACAISARSTGAVVIGADQILSGGGIWFDKPADLAEARRQLEAQRDREQILHVACALAHDGAIVWRHLVEPRIRLRAFSERLLSLYLAVEGEALLSCVGACRIEGPGQMLIERMDAEHAAILGLPMRALLGELRRIGLLLS